MHVAERLGQIDAAVTHLRQKYDRAPEIGVILGSGLGDFGAGMKESVVIPFSEIPYFPVSSVVGHSGKLLLGSMEGLSLAVMSGRVHYYEGYSMEQVVFPARVLGRLGVKTLIVTNAAGGINRDFKTGELMVITDHINLMGANPLHGPNLDELGVRFPDMSEAYNKQLRGLALRAAESIGIWLQQGVYIAVAGPSYETPAEIEMFRRCGADAVGMSTVPEVIAAGHMGMRVLGISCITNMAAGVLPQKLHHAEVLETTARVQREFVSLLERVILLLGQERTE
jgi:purine-nucleoside phosphorylase